MVKSCSAYNCKIRDSAENRKKGISFHSFPKKADLRAKWILAVRRKDWQPSRYSHLCSKHFSPDQFDRTSKLVVRLKEGAVPHIFEGYPGYFQKRPKARKTFPHKISVADNHIYGTTEDPNTYSSYTSSSLKEASNLIDFSTLIEQLGNSDVTQSSLSQSFLTQNKWQSAEYYVEKECLKRKLERVLEMKEKYCEKIKNLQRSVNYQKQKIKSLNQVLFSLKKERFLSINTSEILNIVIN